MSSSNPCRPRSLNRLSQNRTVAPHRPILAAISGALRPASTACRTICARRTRPAPSVRERAIRASSSASSSPNARTRRAMAVPPSRTGPGLNASSVKKPQATCRMHHLALAEPRDMPHTLPAGLSHLGFPELGEEAGQEGIVQCGAHALSLHGLLRAFELGKVEGEAPQQGDVLRSVILAVSGVVFVHGHVEDPMQAVLHPPMGAGRPAEALGAEWGAQ